MTPTCPNGDKRSFPSEAWAVAFARAVLHQGTGDVLEAYRCECRGWHLRNVTKRQQKDRERLARSADWAALHDRRDARLLEITERIWKCVTDG